jgi:hypothetical protein
VADPGRTHENEAGASDASVTQAVAVFSGGSPNIFPSPGKGNCMSSNTMLYAICRMGYHGRATTHGFRAVASTI